MMRIPNDPAQTPRQMPVRLDQLLAESALSHAQRTAIVDGSTRLSYAELDAAVSRLANLLLSHGLKAGDRIALDALNGAESSSPTTPSFVPVASSCPSMS